MSRARQLISQLHERANLLRGRLGVELELLLRADLHEAPKSGRWLAFPDRPWHGQPIGQRFRTILSQYDFFADYDSTVRIKAGTTEHFYGPLELQSTPLDWTTLKRNLTAVLGWLKQTDRVYAGGQPPRLVDHPFDLDDDWQQAKVLRLPRGLVPSNYSAGLHIHFDVDSWFDDVGHVRRFLELWNDFQDDVPAYVVPGRYRSNNSADRGHKYASVQRHYDPDHLANADQAAKGRRTAFAWGGGGDRYRSLNTASVADRGDIEFRFIHATLNIDTIEGWVTALAELIEKARQAAPGDYRGYLDRENPAAAQFLQRRQAHLDRAIDPTEKPPQAPPRKLRGLVPPGDDDEDRLRAALTRFAQR